MYAFMFQDNGNGRVKIYLTKYDSGSYVNTGMVVVPYLERAWKDSNGNYTYVPLTVMSPTSTIFPDFTIFQIETAYDTYTPLNVPNTQSGLLTYTSSSTLPLIKTECSFGSNAFNIYDICKNNYRLRSLHLSNQTNNFCLHLDIGYYLDDGTTLTGNIAIIRIPTSNTSYDANITFTSVLMQGTTNTFSIFSRVDGNSVKYLGTSGGFTQFNTISDSRDARSYAFMFEDNGDRKVKIFLMKYQNGSYVNTGLMVVPNINGGWKDEYGQYYYYPLIAISPNDSMATQNPNLGLFQIETAYDS